MHARRQHANWNAEGGIYRVTLARLAQEDLPAHNFPYGWCAAFSSRLLPTAAPARLSNPPPRPTPPHLHLHHIKSHLISNTILHLTVAYTIGPRSQAHRVFEFSVEFLQNVKTPSFAFRVLFVLHIVYSCPISNVRQQKPSRKCAA